MLSKFLKLFGADLFVAPQSLADKVAELQAQAQEAHFESLRLWAEVETHRDEAARLKTLAGKLGDLIDPAA